MSVRIRPGLLMRHHTKDKGDIAVLKVAADLADQEFIVMSPMTEHAPFDLVVYKGGEFYSVQVKYRKLEKGSISVCFRSTGWSKDDGFFSKPAKIDEIDIYAVYNPETDACYYIKPSGKSFQLRVEPLKNNRSVGIRWAKDHRIVPIDDPVV